MKTKKILLFASFVLLFIFAYKLDTSYASSYNEAENDQSSPFVEVIYLPDGTIERRYANGTVRHDYSVTLQLPMNMTWEVATTTATTFIPPWPDPQDDLANYSVLIFLFLCGIGAGEILHKIHKSLPGPKPVQRPSPKSPFNVY